MTLALPMYAVIKRELVMNFRKLRPFITLVLFLIILSIAAIVSVEMARFPFRRMGSIVPNFVFLPLILSVFTLPGFAASLIMSERDNNTLDMLVLTQVSPSGIIMGKALSVVLFCLFIVMGVLPVLTILLATSPADYRLLAAVTPVLIAVVFSSTMVGILSALLFRKRGNITGISLLGVLVVMGLPIYIPYPVVALGQATGLFSYQAANGVNSFLTPLIPIVCPAVTVVNIFWIKIGMVQYLLSLCYQAGFCGICFLWARRIIGSPVKDREARKRARKLKKAERARNFHLSRKLCDLLEKCDFKNPIVEKELRLGVAACPIRWIFGLLSAGLMAFYFCSQFQKFGSLSAGIYLAITSALAGLYPAVKIADSLVREHEQGDFDMLRLTLLRPHEFVFGKFRAECIKFAPFVIILFVVGLFLLPLRRVGLDMFITSVITLMVTAFVSFGCGAFISAFCKKTRTSSGLALFFTLMVISGAPLVLLIMFGDDAYRIIMFFSPLSALASNLQHERGAQYTAYWMGNNILFLVVGAILFSMAIQVYSARMKS